MEIKGTVGGQKPINSLQLSYRGPSWLTKITTSFPQNMHGKRVQFPVERNAFVLVKQHGHRDVRCKPAIYTRFFFKISTQIPR